MLRYAVLRDVSEQLIWRVKKCDALGGSGNIVLALSRKVSVNRRRARRISPTRTHVKHYRNGAVLKTRKEKCKLQQELRCLIKW